jgi:mono/diheme cytochrome c family protein
MSRCNWRCAALTGFVVALICAGCSQDMADQPRYEPLEGSRFFADHRASRPLVEGVVPRGDLRVDQAFYEGRVGDRLVNDIPWRQVAEKLSLSGDEQQLALSVLQRGRQRFDIYCAPCHGRSGEGNGMVVARGFPAPPSYHSERLRNAPDGHLFDVTTRGFGRMNSYASQVPTHDRWAIVAYVRALQLSQHADDAALSDEDQDQIRHAGDNP